MGQYPLCRAARRIDDSVHTYNTAHSMDLTMALPQTVPKRCVISE